MVSGGLMNNRIGYSANIPFGQRAHHQGQPSKITYAGVGIMVGEADTAAGFPSGTHFAPYAALRNTTPNPLLVRLGVNYMTGPQPVTRALPAVPLAPFETRYFTSELFDAAGLRDLSGMINLSASFEGRAGDLELATGSTDQSGSYVFSVEPQGLGRSFSKEGHYWKAADGFDTMFALWNPTDKQQDFLVTFFFGQGGAPYKLPITLGRNASTTIDVSKLIAAQQPDEDGNVIPFGTREGSMVFSSAKEMTQWMTVAISIGILNAQAATCGGICTNCCGYTGFGVTPSPGYCPLGLTAQCGAQATYCSGVVYSFTTSSSWSSSNTSVLTVNNTTQKGLVTGVAPGTATVTALFPSVIVFTGTICGDNTPTCPTSRPAPGGPVTAYDFTLTLVTPDLRPNGTSSPNTTTVRVQTTPAVTGQAVQFSTLRVTNSGGHIQTGTYHPVSTATAVVGSFAQNAGATDGTGKFETVYTAPIFGGTTRVRATVASRLKEQFAQIYVPSLLELGSGTNYVLTGFETKPQHPQGTNHYGTSSTNPQLVAIADGYKNQFYPSGIPADRKLKFNDQSLIDGGKFEIPGDWSSTADHQEHKLGRNCDISKSNVDAANYTAVKQIIINNRGDCCGGIVDHSDHWHTRHVQ